MVSSESMISEVEDTASAISPSISRTTQRRSSESISVIVPTRNERDNVQVLARRLADSFSVTDIAWELIFVDDSDDETPRRIGELSEGPLPIVLVHREPGMRVGGLAGAVVEGFGVANGEVLVVMDGDLQHPPEAVLPLAESVIGQQRSIAVGSRFVAGVHLDGLSGPIRRMVSHSSRVLVRALFPSIWKVSDPMSGLFALRQSVLEGAVLAPDGFKILLEVLVQGNWDAVVDVPYEFGTRSSGGSKANLKQGLHFVRQVLRLRLSTVA